MYGVSGTGSMPRNCGMDGMHGNTPKRHAQKAENSTVKQQNNQPAQIPNEILGNKINVKI